VRGGMWRGRGDVTGRDDVTEKKEGIMSQERDDITRRGLDIARMMSRRERG